MASRRKRRKLKGIEDMECDRLTLSDIFMCTRSSAHVVSIFLYVGLYHVLRYIAHSMIKCYV